MPTPDTIIFAIRAALRLGEAAQQAYIDSTRNRGLLLPLPEFDPSVNATVAANFLHRERPDFRPPGLAELMVKTDPNNDEVLTLGEQRQLVEFYFEARLENPVVNEVVQQSSDGSFFTEDGLKAMVTIRQWERGAPGVVTPLQRVAGTIVEIAVDYFSTTPGAFNERSPQGKAIRVLLTALDDIAFSTTPIHDLPAQLTVATIESLATHADVLTGDESTQELIKVTARALALDVKHRIEIIRAASPQGNADKEQRVVDWAEVVFRSVLSSGGRLVVQDPKRYLGIDNQGTSALVNHVGLATLDFVLASPEGEVDRIFGREGLDTVVRAALKAVGEHPEILTNTNNQGLKKLLKEIAEELGQMEELLAPGSLPEVTRIILEKGGENLALIWPDKNDPKQHLFVAAASQMLKILSRKESGQSWEPKFGKEQLLELVDFVLDEFLRNPGWLIDQAGQRSKTFEAALNAVVVVLKKRADNRLSPETGIAVIRAALQAVAQRKKFLDGFQGGDLAIAAVIDTVIGKLFDTTLDDTVSWAVVRHEVITGLIDQALNSIGKSDLGPANVQELAVAIDTQLTELVQGKPLDLAQFRKAVDDAITPA